MIGRKTTLAVLIFQAVLLVVIGAGYINLANDNAAQNDDITATIDRGRQIIGCLTTYATELQHAIEDRDTVNSTTRAATREWVQSVRDLASEGDSASAEEFFDVTDVYLAALNRVDHTVVLNPYPKIVPCLNAVPDSQEKGQALRLVVQLAAMADPGMPGAWDNECLHRRVTIRGTDGNNNISGTNHRDVIFAYSGNDIVDGGPGRDRICGRYGADTLSGGTGFDRINGGNGGGIDLCFAERIKKCP